MIKNGILIKFTSLEGTLTDNDKTILGNKHAICSDDERELYVLHHSKKPSIYLNFKSRDIAMSYLKNFDKKLSKRYECRIFTDMQMSKCEVSEKGLLIPFTKKQMDEVYYI